MKIFLLVFALLLGFVQSATAQIPVEITVDAATVESVEALERDVTALTTRVANGELDREEIKTELAALKTALNQRIDAVQAQVDALTATVGDHTATLNDHETRLDQVDLTDVNASIANIMLQLNDLAARVAQLEAGLAVPLTDNEKAIIAVTEPFMHLTRISQPLTTVDITAMTGQELIDTVNAICRPPWACIADPVLNPQYQAASKVLPSMGLGDRRWRSFAVAPDVGGVILLPGRHEAKRLAKHVSGTKTVNEPFLRNAPTLRSLGSAYRDSTVLECLSGHPRGGSFCYYNERNRLVIYEGFTFLGQLYASSNATIGATSRNDARLALVDMTIRGGGNCVRTTGRMIIVAHTTLDTCSGIGSAHNAYVSSDFQPQRTQRCPMAIFVNVTSINPVKGHAFKSKCAVNRIEGGYYSSAEGLAIEIPQGGATMARDVTVHKPKNSPNWRIISIGNEFSDWADGSPNGKRSNGDPRTEAEQCAYMRHDMTPYVPSVSGVPMGRMTLRNFTIVNERHKDGQPTGVTIWANPYIKTTGDPTCRPPHEAINVRASQGTFGFVGDWVQL